MRNTFVALAILGSALGLLSSGAPAGAQAPRTWVSGVGDDVNPCSRTAPCKTFAGAISKTANGGEISVLDPGGYGSVTITKSMTIDGGGGQVASSVVQGVNGIVVAAQPTDIVTLRNIRLNGTLGNASNPANAGQTAVVFQSGQRLEIRNVDIVGFNVGAVNVTLGATGALLMDNCTLTNNGSNGANAYVKVSATAGTAVVSISNCTFQGGSNFAGNGVLAGNGASVTISNSVFQSFTNGAQTTGSGTLFVDTSLFVANINGLNAGGGVINITNNSFFANGTALGGAAGYVSAANNKIVGNQGANPAAMNVK
jgi:hypothetical protein